MKADGKRFCAQLERNSLNTYRRRTCCDRVAENAIENIRGGDPKITRIIFKWFIKFYTGTITTLVSFKVLSFWLDTLVPTFFPLLKTFLEFFSADVVEDIQRFLFHFADMSKTVSLSSCLSYEDEGTGKVAWRKVGWIARMRDNRHVIFYQKLLHTQGRVGRGIVVVKEPITAAPHVWSFFSLHYRVIFSTPANKIVDPQFVEEEQIPFSQFH